MCLLRPIFRRKTRKITNFQTVISQSPFEIQLDTTTRFEDNIMNFHMHMILEQPEPTELRYNELKSLFESIILHIIF